MHYKVQKQSASINKKIGQCNWLLHWPFRKEIHNNCEPPLFRGNNISHGISTLFYGDRHTLYLLAPASEQMVDIFGADNGRAVVG